MRATIPRGILSAKLAKIVPPMKTLLSLLLEPLAFLIWLLPSFLLSQSEYANEFTFIPLVRVAASKDTSQLLPLSFSGFNFIPEHQGGELITLVLQRVTGLSLQELLFIPIGGALIPIVFYALCRKLAIPRVVAALVTLSIAVDPTVVMTSYSISLYAWTRILLIVFLLLYFITGSHKTINLVTALFLVFAGTYIMYWTDPVLMITFSVIINILIIGFAIIRKRDPASRKRTLTLSASLVFIVTYLGFGSMFYWILSKVVNAGGITTSTSSLQARVQQLLGLAKTDLLAHGVIASPSTVSAVQAIRYLLMAAPIGFLLAKEVGKFLRTHKIHSSEEDTASLFLWSLVGVILVHATIYSIYGHLSTRYFALLGPLMAMIALRKLGVSDRFSCLFALVLVALTIPAFNILYRQTTDNAAFPEVESAASWLNRNSREYSLLSDLGIYGMFAMESVVDGSIPQYVAYSSSRFEGVVESAGDNLNRYHSYGFVVVDKLSKKPTFSTGWGYYEPLSLYLNEINANEDLNAVYDNGAIRIFVPSQ